MKPFSGLVSGLIRRNRSEFMRVARELIDGRLPSVGGSLLHPILTGSMKDKEAFASWLNDQIQRLLCARQGRWGSVSLAPNSAEGSMILGVDVDKYGSRALFLGPNDEVRWIS